MEELDWTRPLMTTQGNTARVLVGNRKGPRDSLNRNNFPMVVLVHNPEVSIEEALCYTIDGNLLIHKDTPMDLVNVPKVSYRWMNLYLNPSLNTSHGSLHEAREAARASGVPEEGFAGRVAFKLEDGKVTIAELMEDEGFYGPLEDDDEEGDGLQLPLSLEPVEEKPSEAPSEDFFAPWNF